MTRRQPDQPPRTSRCKGKRWTSSSSSHWPYFALAGLLTLVRLVKGPWILDRTMALDVLVVLIVAGSP